MVAEKFVYPKDMLEETVEVMKFAGGKHIHKMAHVQLKPPCVNGRVKAVCIPNAAFDDILGCKYVVAQFASNQGITDTVAMAVTRSAVERAGN